MQLVFALVLHFATFCLAFGFYSAGNGLATVGQRRCLSVQWAEKAPLHSGAAVACKEGSSRHLVSFTVPSGLLITQPDKDGDTFCMLERNYVSLPPAYLDVYEERELLSKQMCEEIISRTEQVSEAIINELKEA